MNIPGSDAVVPAAAHFQRPAPTEPFELIEPALLSIPVLVRAPAASGPLAPLSEWQCSHTKGLLGAIGPHLSKLDQDHSIEVDVSQDEVQLVVRKYPLYLMSEHQSAPGWPAVFAAEVQLGRAPAPTREEEEAYQSAAWACARQARWQLQKECGDVVTVKSAATISSRARALRGKSAAELEAHRCSLKFGTTAQERATKIEHAVNTVLLALPDSRIVLPAEPFGTDELDDCLNWHIFSNGFGTGYKAQRMFRAIRTDASLSNAVLGHANDALEHLAFPESPLDGLIGASLFATTLILSLPRDALQELLFTRDEVERFSREAVVALGYMALYQKHGEETNDVVSRVCAVGGLPQLLFTSAREFVVKYPEDPTAIEFMSAVAILRHNMERMEELSRMQPENEWQGVPLLELLDEMVPPRFESLTARSHAALLTLIADDAAPQVTVHVETEAAGEAKTPAKSKKKEKVRARRAAARAPAANATARPPPIVPPLPPLETKTASPAQPAPYAETRHPGSRPHGDREHFHPRDRRALPKAEVKARREKLKAYQKLGKLFRFTEWTPELGDVVRASWQAHNAREATR